MNSDLQFVVLDILSDVETSGGLVGFSTLKNWVLSRAF